MISILHLGTLFVLFIAFASSENVSYSQEVAIDDLQRLTLSNNELAFNLHRRLVSNSSTNVFFSPLSISTVFGMLFYGTSGTTAEELRKALGYEKADLPSDLVHLAFNHFLNEVLNTTDFSHGCVLKTANAIFLNESFELLEQYKNDITELYEAAIRDVDFSKNSSEIVEVINSWVKEKTDGKIEKLVDDFDPSTLMVLLNAVYFKGTWKTQFDPEETTDEIFFNNGEESEGRKVPLMHMTSIFLYESSDNFQVLEMPYKGEKVSMLIFLPDESDGLKSLEDSLTPKKLAEIQERLEETKVDVSLPKFKLNFEDELSDEMQALGANHIFKAGADFSGMTNISGVFVSEIHHKAIIEVNEEGSEAAAVTGNVIDRMKSPQIRADHPFCFVILEKRSNMILFMGRVNEL